MLTCADLPALVVRGRLGYLWHFTSLENLSSICIEGIRPRSGLRPGSFKDVAFESAICRRANWPPLDCTICGQRHRIADLVPLFVVPQNPMTYRRRDKRACLLRIDTRKLLVGDVHLAIADGNVASGPAKTTIYPTLEGLDHLDWNVLNARSWSDNGADEPVNRERKRKRAAEVLVAPHVPASAIRDILTKSQHDRHFALNQLERHKNAPPCLVASDYFL